MKSSLFCLQSSIAFLGPWWDHNFSNSLEKRDRILICKAVTAINNIFLMSAGNTENIANISQFEGAPKSLGILKHTKLSKAFFNKIKFMYKLRKIIANSVQ